MAARRRLSWPAALVVAGLIAFNRPLVDESFRGLRTELEMCLVLVLYVLLDRRPTAHPRGEAVIFGLVGAALVLTRTSYLPMILVATAVSFLARYRPLQRALLPVSIGTALVVGAVAGHRIALYAREGDAFIDTASYARWNANVEQFERGHKLPHPELFPTETEYIEKGPYFGPRLTYAQYLFELHTVPEFVAGTLAGFGDVFANTGGTYLPGVGRILGAVIPGGAEVAKALTEVVDQTVKWFGVAGLIGLAVSAMVRRRLEDLLLPGMVVIGLATTTFVYHLQLIERYRNTIQFYPFLVIGGAWLFQNAVHRELRGWPALRARLHAHGGDFSSSEATGPVRPDRTRNAPATLSGAGRGRLQAFVERALVPGMLMLVVLIPAPFLTGVSDVSSAILGAVLAFIGVGVAGAQRELRRFAASLFLWAFALRLSALLLLSAVPGYDRSAFLGPDSASYYLGSQMLAAGELPPGRSPIQIFGSTDIAHYYLFAAALSAFNVDLFGLQLLNGALSALTALVTFLWCKAVLPSHAALTGVAVACGPTLIAMSVTDLLKDPSIVMATVLALWAITRLLGSSRVLSAAGWGVLVVAALMYLRMDRFYVAAYLEAAFIIVVFIVLARGVMVTRAPIAILALAVLAAEAGPMALGWPSSPEAIATNVVHVERTPAIRDSPPGIIDNNGPDVSGLPPPVQEPVKAAALVLDPLADIVRRLYGPFVWIPPPDLYTTTILRGDYILYPGMLLWYALLPFMLLGVGVVLWRFATLHTTDIVLPAVAVFLAVYLAQYLAINLSYRQREDVMPLLFILLPFGIALWSRFWRPRFLYGVYWLALFVLAVTHLVILRSA
jgi:hypothetical protein